MTRSSSAVLRIIDRIAIVALMIAGTLLLASCTPDPYKAAWGACIDTYTETPVIHQRGDQVKLIPAQQSCASYVDMVGKLAFTESWTNDAWVAEHRYQLRMIAELRAGDL